MKQTDGLAEKIDVAKLIWILTAQAGYCFSKKHWKCELAE